MRGQDTVKSCNKQPHIKLLLSVPDIITALCQQTNASAFKRTACGFNVNRLFVYHARMLDHVAIIVRLGGPC